MMPPIPGFKAAIFIIVGNSDFLTILTAAGITFAMVFVIIAAWKLARFRMRRD